MVKVTVVKNGEARLVKASRLNEYLQAGWAKEGAPQQPSVPADEGEEVIRLKPPAKSSRAAVKIAQEDDNNIQGE